MKVFLIAHTNGKGSNIACAEVTASSSNVALRHFDKRYPLRKATTIGVKGEKDAGVRLA